MPSWNELIAEYEALPDDGERSKWLLGKQQETFSHGR